MTDNKLLEIAVTTLDKKKARDIKLLKVGDLTILANYFLIATGGSGTQVKSLADEVEFKLSEAGLKPTRTEGYQGANWIILDYTDVIIHIFYEETRNFYDLERLWQDGEDVDINNFIKNLE